MTTAPSCTQCGGATRIAPVVPTGYVGPGVGAVLYQYTKLREPDRAFRMMHGDGRVWMCDACQLAGVFNDRRGEPASPGAGHERPA